MNSLLDSNFGACVEFFPHSPKRPSPSLGVELGAHTRGHMMTWMDVLHQKNKNDPHPPGKGSSRFGEGAGLEAGGPDLSGPCWLLCFRDPRGPCLGQLLWAWPPGSQASWGILVPFSLRGPAWDPSPEDVEACGQFTLGPRRGAGWAGKSQARCTDTCHLPPKADGPARGRWGSCREKGPRWRHRDCPARCAIAVSRAAPARGAVKHARLRPRPFPSCSSAPWGGHALTKPLTHRPWR